MSCGRGLSAELARLSTVDESMEEPQEITQNKDGPVQQPPQENGETSVVVDQATTGTDHSTRATVMPQAGEKLPDTIAGRLSKSQDLKEEGNTLFKQQEWRKAIKKYHHSLMYVKGITDRGDKLLALGGLIDTQTTVLKPTKEQEKMAEEVLVALHNNIAACLMKVSDWEKAIPHTVKVLELRPGNSKALFRRGMACLNLSRLEEARELLTKAEKIDPKDINIQKQLQILQRKEELYKKSEQKMYEAMFAQTN